MKKLKVIYSPSGRALEYSQLATNPYLGCAHGCDYCLDGETLILKSNMRAVPIKELNIGDVLIGVTQENHSGMLKFTKSTILNKSLAEKQVFEIELENGMRAKCSGDHRWLSDRGYKYVIGTEQGYNRRPFLTENNSIRTLSRLIISPEATEEYMKGYLSGIIRGDGHLGIHKYDRYEIRYDGGNNLHREGVLYQFNLRLKDRAPIERTKQFLNTFGIRTFDFKFTETMSGIRTSKQKDFEQIKNIIQWSDSGEYRRGFLSGLYDAEGWFDKKTIRIANCDPITIQFLEDSLKFFGFQYKKDIPKKTKNQTLQTIRLIGGSEQRIRFWQHVVPALERKVNIIGNTVKNSSQVKNIINLGYEDLLYDIQTSTENFIANGMISHNCYAIRSLHKTPEEFRQPKLRKDYLKKLEVDAVYLNSIEERRPIQLSFMCDPYQVMDVQNQITRMALEILFDHGLNVQILTKGGARSERDFDLLAKYKDKCSYGATLVFVNDAEAMKREPGAAPTSGRIRSLRKAHDLGIHTWVSLEPCFHFDDAVELIDQTHEFVDEYKIGKINYDKKAEQAVDWQAFANGISQKLIGLKKSYYIKDDLRKYIEG